VRIFNPIAPILRQIVPKEAVLAIIIFFFASALIYVIHPLFAKKKTLIKVTFRKNTANIGPNHLMYVIKINLLKKLAHYVFVIACIAVLLTLEILNVFFLIFILIAIVGVFISAFQKIMIYDNAIVFKTVGKSTVLFKDLDYMTNVGTVRYYRNIPSGYKFLKNKRTVIFLKNSEYDHLEQFEKIFRTHPAVEKYEENPGLDPNSMILDE